jgi:hypothetical protein
VELFDDAPRQVDEFGEQQNCAEGCVHRDVDMSVRAFARVRGSTRAAIDRRV